LNTRADELLKHRAWRQATLGTAMVAGAFVLFVVAQLAVTWGLNRRSDPNEHPRLAGLRAELAKQPGAEGIKQEIRHLDLSLRTEFFRSDEQLRTGAWLLLAGLVAFAISATLSARAWAKPPMPAKRPAGSNELQRTALAGRCAVGAVALLLAAAALAVPAWTMKSAQQEKAEGVWTRFRGPRGGGISPYDNVPSTFDVRAGLNVRWKKVVPLSGKSSPAVWNDRVFITGASKHMREVYCFDALSGRMLWRRPVSAGPASAKVPENVMEDTSYAAPTAATDGKNVCAVFANGDVVCLDFFGKEIWTRNLGTPDNFYGHASSPIIFRDRVIVQMDQADEEDGKSFIIALDKTDGKTVWKTDRSAGSAWPTPIAITAAGREQIITCANPWAIAYDPGDGREIWRLKCLAGDGGPSPVFAGGFVLAVNAGSPLTAIRPDGRGDVTKTHVAWQYDDGLPDTCSPLAAGGLVWLLTSDGIFTCLDIRSGKKVWETDLDTSFYSSPSLAAGGIYLLSRKGGLIVAAAGREYRKLADGDLGEGCDTSPAFADGRIYIRGKTHLFCIKEQGD